jgi:spore germination protein YaaH
MDLLSPQAFAAQPDGHLTGRIPPEIAAAAQGRLAIMPAVVNADFSVDALSALLQSRASRTRLTLALVAAAQRQRLRGFVIDFEGLSRAQRQHYAAFLAEMRTRFHAAGLRLGVAVPAPVGTFRDAFDYKAIGRAADLVVLMAYDQHSRGSAPGPIAGYNWVERVVADTVATIPPAKLLLGLPLYHRSWTETSGFRDSTAGSHGQALSLLNESGGALQWDPLSRSPWFRIENPGTESGASPDSATVWLEDSRSVSEKIELARRYKLAGVAAWRLGQEDPGIWGVFENYRGAKLTPVAQPRHRRATQSRAALARH